MNKLIRFLLLGALLMLPALPRASAQSALVECGPITEMVDPVSGISEEGDDFGLYRARYGGLHTGADLAFYQYGDPVYAVARGRVTYADPAGWDTENGVVILEHVTPTGEVFYSLYGHMEEIANHAFPPVGVCLDAGTIVGAVGDPSLSAPHLHFEIRTFGPDDGGPGYWDTNPLEAGWLNPLDFLRLWQIRLMPGTADGAADGPAPALYGMTALHAPTLPPVPLADGGLVIAAGRMVEGLDAAGALHWRLELSASVAGMIGLPDGRVVVRAADDVLQVLQNGRYVGLWRPGQPLAAGPFLVGEALVVLTSENALLAYTLDGLPLWQTPALGERQIDVVTGGDRIGIGVRVTADATRLDWNVLSATGQELYRLAPTNTPVAAFDAAGGLYLADGTTLFYVGENHAPTVLATLPGPASAASALLADGAGVIVYLGGSDRTLLAYAPDGSPRWESTLPDPAVATNTQPPLLASGDGCLLYALAADGGLHVLRAQDGALLNMARLYAGGRNGQPNARLLAIGPGERVTFGAGFLSVVTLDGYAFAGVTAESCATASTATPEA
ncbi:MAG: PQQ-binding-like beta-propeller repeat protein [Anaerolineae bacterium]|nr:PQQ-binding-like beta-propeller repeat protein [Anaerolineae bacterium]